jgi:hypothetical protein
LHLVKRIIKISRKEEKKSRVTPYVWLSLFPEKIKKFPGKEGEICTSMPVLDGFLSIPCLPFILSRHFNKPANKRG